MNLINNNIIIKNNLKNIIFYMDNAKIHHAIILRDLASTVNFFFGAPYSPMLNPIEEFFGLLKHYIRKNDI